MSLNRLQQMILNDRLSEGLDTDANRNWIILELETLQLLFENPTWLYSAYELHTQAQIGYLTGLLDLESEDKLEFLGLVLGWMPEYGGEDFPGMKPEYCEPGPSSKDIRITRWVHSVLIDYLLNGNGTELVHRLGYITKTDIKQAQRIASSLELPNTTD